MAVKDNLDKIVERHPDVIGAMVVHNCQVRHNLESPYDIVDVDTILDTFAEIFEQTTILEDEGYDFGEVMIDFANHSFIVRSIDGGLLAVLSPRMQRGQLVKLHVGLGIFGKAIEKAIAEEASAVTASPEPEPEMAPVTQRVKSEPVVMYDASNPVPAEEPVVEQEEPQDESALSSALGLGKKRRGGFRGTKELLAARLASKAHEATSEPVAKEDAPRVNEDGVPLRPDGTPMKMRKYRGSVFWE